MYTYICQCVCMYACMHARMYACMYACMVCMYVYVHVHIRMYMYTHARTHTHTHTHAHTHTHTHTLNHTHSLIHTFKQGLPHDVTEGELRMLFSACGPVGRVTLVPIPADQEEGALLSTPAHNNTRTKRKKSRPETASARGLKRRVAFVRFGGKKGARGRERGAADLRGKGGPDDRTRSFVRSAVGLTGTHTHARTARMHAWHTCTARVHTHTPCPQRW